MIYSLHDPHMNDRSREVFRRLVESYLITGDPVGSRFLSREVSENISAATIRNVMQDLEHLGLLQSPHVSAGRIPTQLGLRLFIDGMIEYGDLPEEEQRQITRDLSEAEGQPLQAALARVGHVLSGLTSGASLVLAPKSEETPIKHIEFVSLTAERALVVLVLSDGHVENRVFAPPPGLTPSAMREAANFLNVIAAGRKISELRQLIGEEVNKRRNEIDEIATRLIEEGVARWAPEDDSGQRLIVTGRSKLLESATTQEDLNQIRHLFDDLERKKDLASFLELTDEGAGVRIFIGSENKLFSLSGSSLVVSPYMNSDRKIIGALGVIGPTRLNYARIVPIVNYTAQLMGRLLPD